MPISSFTQTSRRRHLPASLPLTGDKNYNVRVRKNQSNGQRSITKRGNRIEVRSSNVGDNVSISSSSRGISYSKGGQSPTHLSQNGNNIFINRPGGNDVRITKNGNTIAVDRPGSSNDVSFTQTPQGLNIDRFGTHNDVRITAGPNQVRFEYGQSLKNTSVTLTEGIEFDTVAFQNEITLDPQGLGILQDWFSDGKIDGADLLTLTQRGDLLEADGLLR